MALQPRKVSNPLTLIGMFAGISEVAATGVLPLLTGHVQDVFVWFVMLFPVFLVGLFFLTLNFNNKVIYAPSDFQDERHFMETITSDSYSQSTDSEKLRQFWKPDGAVNDANERRLVDWMRGRDLQVSVASFVYGSEYEDQRRMAVSDILPHNGVD